jgi:hypothetical protein
MTVRKLLNEKMLGKNNIIYNFVEDFINLFSPTFCRFHEMIFHTINSFPMLQFTFDHIQVIEGRHTLCTFLRQDIWAISKPLTANCLYLRYKPRCPQKNSLSAVIHNQPFESSFK